jgi:N utilization substance protein A
MVYYTYSGMRSPIGDFFIPGHIVFIYLLLLTYNNISMSLFDLKLLGSALNELEEERGIPKEKVIEAIEYSLGAAYKKEYGEKGQIVRSHFNPATGDVEFYQVKIVVDETVVRRGDEEAGEDDNRTRYNEEHHILIDSARMMKKDVQLDDEITFPLETHEDFGRIAAQTAKQVIMQKIREAERSSIVSEYGERQGEIVSGHVQRFEHGTLFIDLGRATAVMNYEDQIPGERYRQGERVRALLKTVDENSRNSFLVLTRSHPDFVSALFATEVPEMKNGIVSVKAIAREAGGRTKLAVISNDPHIDPVGSLVGQRGVRVSTVMSELGGEKIDVIEWSEDPKQLIEDAISPAEVISVTLNEEDRSAVVEVSEDQQSLAIGRGGQNVRLAAKLTGWDINIQSKAKPTDVSDEPNEVDSTSERESAPGEMTSETPTEDAPEETTQA